MANDNPVYNTLVAVSTVLRLLKFKSRTLLLSSAAIAAATLVLRHFFSRDVKFILELARIGRRVQGNEFDEYDIIIVGGGTSGCVLASRLSENPSIRVLLLETGGSGKALAFSRTPSSFGKLFHSKYVHNLRTEPQIFAKGKKSYWPRGKLLGGCSSINAQMAQYGAPGDFDQWAESMGDDSWSWKNFSRYFTKFENYVPDPKYPLVDPSVRGSGGPVRIGYFNNVSNGSYAFIDACKNIGIPFTADFNGPAGTMGVSRVLTYIDAKRERVSSETAYLTKDVLARSNLKVAIHAQVTRILFDKVDGALTAVGVEFANTKNGPTFRARARKEVILSAGAVHSPHLLMLSGVGPAQHLKENGIPVVLDLPGVGSHLVDHPVVDFYFKDKFDASSKFLKPQTISDVGKFFSAIAQYHILRTGGPLTTNFGESAAFIRSDDPALFPHSRYPEKLEDSTSGSGSPDLELFTTPFAYKDHGDIFFDVHTFSLHVYLLRPTSSGTIRLKSSNPWDHPSLNPNYLQAPDDVSKLLRGARLILQLAQTEPLASLLDPEFKRPDLDHELHLKSDAELIEVIKERVETLYHPASTCRMAPLAKDGVVDSQQRVYGIRGLRVCDASIFPWIVSGHTAGACYAMGEKLSDLIKAEVTSKESSRDNECCFN